MDAITRTVNLPAPAGYDADFAMPEAAQPRSTRPAEATGQAPDLAASAATMLTAAKRADYAPIGIGEVATAIMVAMVWRYLRGAPARIRAVAADEPMGASWLPADDHAERIAFEARYGRGSRR